MTVTVQRSTIEIDERSDGERRAIFSDEILRIAEGLKEISLRKAPNTVESFNVKKARNHLMASFGKELGIMNLRPPQKR